MTVTGVGCSACHTVLRENAKFCPECGTRLYHSMGPAAPSMTIKPGTLDDKYAFTPTAHIWTRSAQPWFVFPDGMPKFEKAPPEADTLDKIWTERTSR